MKAHFRDSLQIGESEYLFEVADTEKAAFGGGGGAGFLRAAFAWMFKLCR